MSEDELPAETEHLQTFLDDTIRPGDTMAQLKNRPKLQAFFDSHCQLRHYSFCVKKCEKEDCRLCF